MTLFNMHVQIKRCIIKILGAESISLLHIHVRYVHVHVTVYIVYDHSVHYGIH